MSFGGGHNDGKMCIVSKKQIEWNSQWEKYCLPNTNILQKLMHKLPNWQNIYRKCNITQIQGTKVILNMYNLSPMNNCLYPIGLGIHHSGIELSGSKYAFD